MLRFYFLIYIFSNWMIHIQLKIKQLFETKAIMLSNWNSFDYLNRPQICFDDLEHRLSFLIQKFVFHLKHRTTYSLKYIPIWWNLPLVIFLNYSSIKLYIFITISTLFCDIFCDMFVSYITYSCCIKTTIVIHRRNGLFWEIKCILTIITCVAFS